VLPDAPLVSLLEALTPRLGDANSKVALQALEVRGQQLPHPPPPPPPPPPRRLVPLPPRLPLVPPPPAAPARTWTVCSCWDTPRAQQVEFRACHTKCTNALL
jgi:hypothetical protein